MAIKPYLQLVRLPNLFTAAADSLAGWLLVGGSHRAPGQWVPLVLASVCTYAGGVVLNDVFDLDVDRVERPNRPIPSGKVGRGTAAALGSALLLVGLALAVVSATRHGWVVETALIACLLSYDAGVKRTVLGPEFMGACRGLNLLLGMSQSTQLGGPVGWLAAGSYAGFVTGITWISRSEVDAAFKKNIVAGLTVQNLALLGFVVACTLPGRFPHPGALNLVSVTLGVLLLAVIGGALNLRTNRVLKEPTPLRVQGVVKFGIMSLVWLHVGLVLAVRGPGEAIAVGLFWLPAAYTGRWIYST